MNFKKLAVIFAAALIVFAFAACEVSIREPESPKSPALEEPSEPDNIEEPDEPEEIPEETNPLEGIDEFSFASFEEITEMGYYPLWMQPDTIIIYDEKGVPEIIEGGIITEEDSKKEEFAHIWYFDHTIEETVRIKANTKVEYFKDGFMQNIYYLWPDGSYNLSPHEIMDYEIKEESGYMTFEEITAAGYYPLWMQPNTYIIYDENGKPEITEGGELSAEEISGREDIKAVGFTDFSGDMKILPETKAEYDLHGFIQNIYYLWPDGNYNLSPFGG